MHSRRFACFLLGAWIAGGLFMAWVATQNFRGVDRLLEDSNPGANQIFKGLGPTASRQLLRYQVSEQNRFYFESWEVAQILLGLFFFFFLLFGTREDKFSLGIALLMVLAVVGQRFVLTPEIASRGRVLDFVSASEMTGEHTKFGVLHSMYVTIESLKMVLGMFLMGRMVMARRRSSSGRDIRSELDMINKANYGHINR